MFRAPHPTLPDSGIADGGHVVVQGDGSLTQDAVLCPDELPACTHHGLEWRRDSPRPELRQ
jgi:hypothetical protein